MLPVNGKEDMEQMGLEVQLDLGQAVDPIVKFAVHGDLPRQHSGTSNVTTAIRRRRTRIGDASRVAIRRRRAYSKGSNG